MKIQEFELTQPLIKFSIAVSFCLLLLPQRPAVAKPAVQSGQTVAVPMEDVQRFTTALSQIKSFYVEPIEDTKLFNSAISGMLQGLDPHSAYLGPEDYADLKTTTSGKFGGLGIEIDMHDGLVRVISPLDDTPAHKAGLKSGDLIYQIDEQPVKGLKLQDAVKKMRGKKDTDVTLGVIRPDATKPLTFKITRAVINVKSVKNRMLEPGYGYVRISNFQDPTAKDLQKALKKLRKENDKKPLNGLVLDLRNNPGGLLTSAVDVADSFLSPLQKLKHEELIVYTKGRIDGAQFRAKASGKDITNGVPLVVLINSGSASGSEIVAGALQDHRRAIVIGEKTFGKGSVQTILPLDKDHAIKLTTALFYTPSGRAIQADGIHPDIAIENIEIPESDDQTLTLLNFRESQLRGHLNAAAKGKAKDENKSLLSAKKQQQKLIEASKKPLIQTDFQLYEALNLLKAMHVMQHQA